MGTDTASSKDAFAAGMSIKHKIMLHVILVIAIAIGASTYISVVTESKVLRDSLIHKGQNIAKNIASSTKSAFWSLNWIFVEDLLHDTGSSTNDDIIFSKIVKPNGEVYLANDKRYYGHRVDASLLRPTESVINDHPFINEGIEAGILLVHPVVIGKDTWHIFVGLSTSPIQIALKNLIYKNIAWGLVFLVISAILSVFLSRTISKPIEDLAAVTKAISDGGRSHTLKISRRDEIGLLGHSFNKMIKSIEDAEKALIASNERFVTVLDSIDATIYVADLSSNEILFMNRAMKDVFGANHEGEICHHVFMNRDTPCPHCTNNDLLDIQNNPSGLVVWEGLNPLVNRWYVNYDRAIKWTDDRLVRIQIAFDTTKLKQLEQKRQEAELKLRQSQKMEAIGKLAGGVAHDLNNILSGIVSYPEVLLLDLPEAHPMRKPLKVIQDSGNRAATIVNDLLTLARRGVAVSKVVNLNDVIIDYLESPEYAKMVSFNPRVQIEKLLADDLKPIIGSPVHLSKALMNIVSNAVEAMPDGGNVEIQTGIMNLESARTSQNPVESGSYIFLRISDEGVGMTPEEQEKIFEPFYTKKVMGRSGTGLGMAVVWGTVEDHDGYIEIDSAVGRGTVFSLYFPTTDQVLLVDSDSVDIAELKGNREKILLVDDVSEQRQIGSIMLKRLNYDVDIVASGEEAIEYVSENPVDLVVLDMIMSPGISGLETFQKMVEVNPKQRAIIASGFSESIDVRKAQDMGAGEYLRKPYSIEMMAEAVGRALGHFG